MIRLALIIILFSFSAFAFENEMVLADPAQEARAEKLFKTIRCVVCKGESLAESNAELAVSMRALVREKLAGGQSDEEVRQYLVARYGETILQKPPFEAKTYVLWLLPLVLLGGGAIIIARKVKNHGSSRTS